MTTGRHPRGLAVLAATETWERFSFYGMQALLMLYMTTQLLPRAGSGGRVLGLAGLRALLTGVLGPMSDQAFASQVFGLYAGLVYLTPLVGGLIGDRVLGGRRTVLLGAGLMAAGHLLLAFAPGFLVALGLLIIGSGCLKGNIATQVGRLYAPADERRDQAFLWFNLGINIGAFAGPLVCGFLGQDGGWHVGFACAGVGMLVGMAVYVAGWRHLPADGPDGVLAATAAHDGSPAETGRVAPLLGLIALSLFYNIPVGQSFNVYPLWIDHAADRHILGLEIPVAWYLASDGLITVLATPLVLALWARQTRAGRLPGAAARIGIGCAMLALADGLLAVLAHIFPQAHALPPLLGFGYFLLASSAYLFVMPVLLAAVARAAPPHLTATLIGTVYAGLFAANLTAGWLARFYESWGAAAFWAGNGAIATLGVLAAIALRRVLTPPEPAAA
ncbi:peptide MFS transporter [Novosphingobium pokkalii]|uniref:Peptide MFS transporter n=1 Tax=Novosphingobium pokkalii TaxID=1770194 RepID=A0ABV7V665_9SPHN|nr:peptide MFS transporter [Novosphingobium pokkalii]GHD00204.1 MFS transporter [Novosphingobium pokkalii]